MQSLRRQVSLLGDKFSDGHPESEKLGVSSVRPAENLTFSSGNLNTLFETASHLDGASHTLNVIDEKVTLEIQNECFPAGRNKDTPSYSTNESTELLLNSSLPISGVLTCDIDNPATSRTTWSNNSKSSASDFRKPKNGLVVDRKTNYSCSPYTCVQEVNDALGNKNFWQHYHVSKSDGDGHCFIYSFINSVNSQLPHKRIPSTKHILRMIEKEAMQHFEKYLQDVEGNSKETLMREMRGYILHKKYDTWFGDLVPLLTSNAFEIDVVIITINSPDEKTAQSVQENILIDCDTVMVMKSDLHYDALVPHVSKRSQTPSGARGIARSGVLREGNHTGTTRATAFQPMMPMGPPNDVEIPRNDMSGSDNKDDKGYEYLNVCVWNINGLTQDKLEDQIAGNLLSRYDLILLSETWSRNSENFVLNSFRYHDFQRSSSHPFALRGSGGLGVLIRHGLNQGLRIHRNYKDIIVFRIR